MARAYRESSGLSRARLAEALGCSPQWIEKIETGARPSSEATALDLDTYFELPSVFHSMWKELKRAGKTTELPPGFPGFMALEAKASVMHIFESMVITGLFQTPEYAHEILNLGRKPEAVKDLVTTRLNRQQILSRETPPEIILLLDETVLHRPIGDRQLRKNQLHHLALLAEEPNVTLQIVPLTTGTYAGLRGAFTIMEFNDSPPMVYTEGTNDGEITEQQDKVRKYTLCFSMIRSRALPSPESIDLLHKIGGSL